MTVPLQGTVAGSSAPRGKRLASSVRIPLLVGLVSLLLLAVLGGALAGRDGNQAGVPAAVLEADLNLTVGAAASVRRALNEGSDDLVQVVRAVDGLPLTERLLPVLRATGQVHGRYLAVGVVEAATGRAVLVADGDQLAVPLGPLPDDDRTVRVLADGRLVQTAPLQEGRGLLVAAVYDPAYLVPALRPSRRTYVLDPEGRAVAAPGGRDLTTVPVDVEVGEVGRDARRRATVLARTAPEGAEVTAGAPVTGPGPAADAGLVVVTDRVVATGGVPGGAVYRLGGLVAALVLALLALAVHGALRARVLEPLLVLQQQAERVAYGDLTRPVEVTRDDEAGAVGRSLERLRLALIRRGVQQVDARDDRVGAGPPTR